MQQNQPTQEPNPGERRPALTIFVVAVLFLGGAAAGVGLAQLLAPESYAASFLAFFVLPISLIASMVAWQGLTMIVLFAKLLAHRKRSLPADVNAALRRKAVVMLPIPALIATPAGVLVGLLGESVFLATALFAVVGTVYGIGLWALAQKDLLPLLADA